MDSIGEWARWAVGGVATGALIVWGHVTGRIKELENTRVTAEELKNHVRDENEKFRIIFEKHDETNDKLSNIGMAVARIEGKLSRSIQDDKDRRGE